MDSLLLTHSANSVTPMLHYLRNTNPLEECANPFKSKVSSSRINIYNLVLESKNLSCILTGRIYDLGGQVLAANSAPCIFHLAREVGVETEEMDTHKFALIDSSTGALSEMKLVEDYVSMISLTLKLQVSRIRDEKD